MNLSNETVEMIEQLRDKLVEMFELIEDVMLRIAADTPLSENAPKKRKMVRLTKALIHAGMTPPGGWNRRQLEAIGISWQDKSRAGWMDRHVGREVTDEAYRRFLDLRSLNHPQEND